MKLQLLLALLFAPNIPAFGAAAAITEANAKAYGAIVQACKLQIGTREVICLGERHAGYTKETSKAQTKTILDSLQAAARAKQLTYYLFECSPEQPNEADAENPAARFRNFLTFKAQPAWAAPYVVCKDCDYRPAGLARLFLILDIIKKYMPTAEKPTPNTDALTQELTTHMTQCFPPNHYANFEKLIQDMCDKTLTAQQLQIVKDNKVTLTQAFFGDFVPHVQSLLNQDLKGISEFAKRVTANAGEYDVYKKRMLKVIHSTGNQSLSAGLNAALADERTAGGRIILMGGASHIQHIQDTLCAKATCQITKLYKRDDTLRALSTTELEDVLTLPMQTATATTAASTEMDAKTLAAQQKTNYAQTINNNSTATAVALPNK
jgi:hypothetical protein